MESALAGLLKAVLARIRAAVGRLDRIWDRAGRPVGRRWLARNLLGSTVVLTYLILNSARRALDGGIAKIHPVNRNGVGTNSLHDGPAAVGRAFEIWQAGYARMHDGTHNLIRFGPVPLARVQTVLEMVLVPFTFVLLYGLNKWLRGRFTRPGDRDGDRDGDDVGTGVGTGAGAPDVGADERSRGVVVTTLAVGAAGIALHAALGLVDQILELVLLARGHDLAPLGSVLHVTSRVRTVLLPLVLAPMVLGWIQVRADRRDASQGADQPGAGWRGWRGAPTSFRVQIVVAAVFAVLMLVGMPSQQSQDALRLWLRSPRLASLGLLAAVLLGATLAIMAARIAAGRPHRLVLSRHATIRLMLIGFDGAAVGAVLRWAAHWSFGAGLLGLGVLVFGLGLLSLPLAPVDSNTPIVTRRGRRVLDPSQEVKTIIPPLLAVAPLTVLTVALVDAAVPSILNARTSGWLAAWAGAAAVLAVITWCVARALMTGQDKPSMVERRHLVSQWGLYGISAGLVVLYVALLADPGGWAPRLGVVAIAAGFLSALAVGFGTVGYLTESRPLPAALDFIGFTRGPVLTLLVAWALLAHAFAGTGYHDVQRTDAALPPQAQLTASQAFDRWVVPVDSGATGASRSGTGGDAIATAPQDAVPMFFVAASGGGIKAATFTAAAIDCLFGGHTASTNPNCGRDDHFDRVFALSGASGGSVGIASVVAERTTDRATGTNTPEGWVEQRLGRDLLSPELAWQLLAEVPNLVLTINPSRDRAAVLEQTWREQFTPEGTLRDELAYYQDRSAAAWPGPMLFLSGTDLNQGCRVNVSALRPAGDGPVDGAQTPAAPFATRAGNCNNHRAEAAPASPPDQTETRDLTDYLCGRNIDLSTAAFLSARFPFVSPAATTTCKEPAGTPQPTGTVSIGDGGYRDNSGAGSILDTWQVLRPLVSGFNARQNRCIVPVFIEIDNGYDGYGATGAPKDVAQLLAPPLGAIKVFSDLSTGPIEQAAAEFSRPLAPGRTVTVGGQPLASRFFRLSLVDHPGVTAPLGWSLSGAAADDLVNQQINLAENRAAITQLRQLIDGAQPLRCG